MFWGDEPFPVGNITAYEMSPINFDKLIEELRMIDWKLNDLEEHHYYMKPKDLWGISMVRPEKTLIIIKNGRLGKDMLKTLAHELGHVYVTLYDKPKSWNNHMKAIIESKFRD